jgi:NADH-quinone oxidoreductase subunit J
MQDLLFYVFAAATLLCGVLVVANPFTRNPVTSAMFLVLTIVSLAGLFVLLHAFFLAAVQVLVYAGAVMVLFLFVVMLLDVKEEQQRHIRRAEGLLGLLTVVVIYVFLLRSFGAFTSNANAAAAPELEGATASLGRVLFTEYLLPFEIVSVLLLVAMVGVILLSKKELK